MYLRGKAPKPIAVINAKEVAAFGSPKPLCTKESRLD
jgi:hypothetical protein